MGPSNLVKAAIFSAVAIGMGFSLMLIPNIELITVVVFYQDYIWEFGGEG